MNSEIRVPGLAEKDAPSASLAEPLGGPSAACNDDDDGNKSTMKEEHKSSRKEEPARLLSGISCHLHHTILQ